jgi:hypothetical protein
VINIITTIILSRANIFQGFSKHADTQTETRYELIIIFHDTVITVSAQRVWHFFKYLAIKALK